MKFIIECIEIARDRLGSYHNLHYGVESVGGHYEGRERTEFLTVEQVIARMYSGDTFVTRVENAPEAEVEEVEGEHGPYIRTKADDSDKDNLLSLGSCEKLQASIQAADMIKRMGGKY